MSDWPPASTAFIKLEQGKPAADRTRHATGDLCLCLCLCKCSDKLYAGRKSNIEKFAGAVETFTMEAMMGDGKALQVPALEC